MCVVCLGAGGSGDLAGDIGGSEAAWRRWRWPRRRLPRPRLGVASGGLAPPPHGLPSLLGGGGGCRVGGEVPPPCLPGVVGVWGTAGKRVAAAVVRPSLPLFPSPPSVGGAVQQLLSFPPPAVCCLVACACRGAEGRAARVARRRERAAVVAVPVGPVARGPGLLRCWRCRRRAVRASVGWLRRARLEPLVPALWRSGGVAAEPRGGACGDLSPVRPDPRLASPCRGPTAAPLAPLPPAPAACVLSSPLLWLSCSRYLARSGAEV